MDMNTATMPPIYVISLARSQERRADMSKRLAQAGVAYELIDAVDGKTLEAREYQDRYRPDLYTRDLAPAEIGCYLSHYRLWERIIRERTPYAIVLEDDALWDDDFFALATSLPDVAWQWDVVLMGYHPAHKKRRINRKLCALSPSRDLVRYSEPASTTLAYMVSLDGAKKLCAQCHTIRAPIDRVWREYWVNDIAFYHVHPCIVHRREVGSDIKTTSNIYALRKQRTFKQRVRRKVVRQWRKLRYALHHLSHPPKAKNDG